MSDSGVCLDSQKNLPHSNRLDSSGKSTDDDDEGSCFSCDTASRGIPTYTEIAMNKLREKITMLKAHIMENLENGSDKSDVNENIEELQELQKALLKLEMDSSINNNKEKNSKHSYFIY